MRVSRNPSDAGYISSDDERCSLAIFLNGEEQRLVVTADDEKGEVVRIKCDDRGDVVVTDGYLSEEKLYGFVKIKRTRSVRATASPSPQVQ